MCDGEGKLKLAELAGETSENEAILQQNAKPIGRKISILPHYYAMDRCINMQHPASSIQYSTMHAHPRWCVSSSACTHKHLNGSFGINEMCFVHAANANANRIANTKQNIVERWLNE